MTTENIALAPIAAVAAAALPAADHLDEMMARVGVDGLVAAYASPALLARIDQHAAEVREALTDAGRAIDAEGLSAYARSIAAGAVRMGRSVPQPGAAPQTPAEWLTADWHLLRLLAVCQIAEAADLL
ncbi:DUF6401 family natural product biosynthesis protein [Actinoplanes sp. NBC_00393]|uniref:DUF6401 family natural product biosynthesis protein n=1 Tax=Actinoplanes sp. NBC_00393 TaxID=2975953 RepID=UPI002E1D0CCA